MKTNKLYILILMLAYVTSSCAKPSPLFLEHPFFKEIGKTKIKNLLYITDVNDKTIVYGLSKNNNLLKQTILFLDGEAIYNKVDTLYTFDKSINAKQIALSDKTIAYINNGSVFEINIETENFAAKSYDDDVLKKSKILNIRIINNEINIFCKENKNDYFIYKIKTKERIDFNFNPGTVINDFYLFDENYYVSGYIKDPFLLDQYAYFTKTDKKGKMIYENQIGSSDEKTIGLSNYGEWLYYKNNKGSFYQSINGKEKTKVIGELFDAKFFIIKKTKFFIKIVDNKLFLSSLHFTSTSYRHQSKMVFKSISFENDSVKKTLVLLTQNIINKFVYETKKKYKKGDAFQIGTEKVKGYNFVAISFSDDGKIIKYYPKKNSYDNDYIILPTKDTKFDKLGDGDEYLLLLFYKDKIDFIKEKEWNNTTIENLKLFFSLKNDRVYYDNHIPLQFNNESIVPILIKINGEK